VPDNAPKLDMRLVSRFTKWWSVLLDLSSKSFTTTTYHIPWWCPISTRTVWAQQEIYLAWKYVCRTESERLKMELPHFQPEYDIDDVTSGIIHVLGGSQKSNLHILKAIAGVSTTEHKKLVASIKSHIVPRIQKGAYRLPNVVATADNILSLPSIFPNHSPLHALGGELLADIMQIFMLGIASAHPKGLSDKRPRIPLTVVLDACLLAHWAHMQANEVGGSFCLNSFGELSKFISTIIRDMVRDGQLFIVEDTWITRQGLWSSVFR